ncbi:DUF3606 domain-containing protein [Danxiaibacter flavus]|uniref:DUF3606 domain-containing protein n=1 Tax=Danxiaibacter flavus TaxID=3049108 RepID=A0ABV3ZHL1_9BACT|nr:DUF3606 domain-containing protein [Chitinophagaceae bacterium DXS]
MNSHLLSISVNFDSYFPFFSGGIFSTVYITDKNVDMMSPSRFSNLQDQRDRNRLSGSEDYELQYLEEKLGVSKQQILDAIKQVGNDRAKVEEYLSKK